MDAPLGATLGGVVDGSVWDKAAVIFGAMFLHVRGLPMFATLLGFGVGLISMSLYRRGLPLKAARKQLVKRYGFLALFGLAHCLFLFYGDIMLTYGLIGMLLALCLAVKDKVLLIIAGCLFGANTLLFIGLAVLMFAIGDESMGQMMLNPQSGMEQSIEGISNSYLGQLILGAILVVASPFTLPSIIMMIGPVMILGFIAARRGVLRDVEAHRKQLQIAMWIGIAVILIIGLPLGLAGAGVISPRFEMPLVMLNQAFGVLTGPGIVAMVALACEPFQRKLNDGQRLPVPIAMFQALGKRSMTGYVMQSILCLIFVVPYGLGLGQGRGAADTFAIAVAMWLVTLVFAYVLELAGKPGPFEYVHRRLSYGKNR
ncbi:DUF418 domain-containing protein [Corynebacterium sp. H130]|uniref:DUF418 domain-containing protein n=1 Tax=Corynebacterium sp. H130 TaxID=3133444 RepID=UPI0030993EDD